MQYRNLLLMASAVLFFCGRPAVASEAQPALVTEVVLNQYLNYPPQPTEMAFFKTAATTTAGTRTALPACATAVRWAFRVNTPTGQAILATLLTAQGAGKNVYVYGTGACNDWTDSESPLTVKIIN